MSFQSPMEMATGYLTFPMSLVPMLPTASLPMPMQGLVGTAAITPGRGIGRFTRAWDFLFTDFHNELERKLRPTRIIALQWMSVVQQLPMRLPRGG